MPSEHVSHPDCLKIDGPVGSPYLLNENSHPNAYRNYGPLRAPMPSENVSYPDCVEIYGPVGSPYLLKKTDTQMLRALEGPHTL